MISFTRADRVSGLIQRILSDILKRDVADPRLQMTIITTVKMSPDLKLARIYYATSGGEKNITAATKAIDSAHGFIKRNLARRLKLRYMPELKFFYDDSFDYGSHIERLLKMVVTENETDHTSN
jgi:ribosome-binding factor A